MEPNREGMLVPVGQERLLLGPNEITWKGKSIPWAGITGLACGIVPSPGRHSEGHFVISLTDGVTLLQIDWTFNRWRLESPGEWEVSCFHAASQVVWDMVQMRIADEMVAALRAGGALAVGPLRIDGEGLALTEAAPEEGVLGGLGRYLSVGNGTAGAGEAGGKRLAWADLDVCQQEEAGIAVYGRGEERPWCTLEPCSTWNAVCLPGVLQRVGGFHELEGEASEGAGA